MGIRFGRAICGNFPTATSREWLITNGIGGYGSGTITGTLTRAYHGLLIAALKPPVERTLLLTKLDETVTYQGQTLPLYTNHWTDGRLEPHGYRQIESFQLDGMVPHWTYAIGDALLDKRIWMEQGENTTYIRYDLSRGNAPLRLSLKVVANYRYHHGGTPDWPWQVEAISGGLRAQAFSGGIPFYVLTNRGTMTIHPVRLESLYLAVEHYRGTGEQDAPWQIAMLDVTLAPGEGLTVVASTQPQPNLDGETALRDRQSHEQFLLNCWDQTHPDTAQLGPTAPDWIRQLVLAADQFVVDRPLTTGQGEAIAGKTIIAGYPWFTDWGRDTMISLPGLAIATGRPELARPILQVFGQYVSEGMIPNLFPESNQTPVYNTVDATLWYFEAVRAYLQATDDVELLAELFPILASIIDWHCRGTRYHIQLDPNDGLIYAGEAGVQLTWMDAIVDGWVVTPRIGKPVEINALWYNALVIMTQLAEKIGYPDGEYQRLATQCVQGFQRFWNPDTGYCFDVLDTPDGGNDPALRPNQTLAIALPYGAVHDVPLLSPAQEKSMVDAVARELSTSYGMRSLSPAHPDYVGLYGGNQFKRDAAYHQGTVWSWLIGPFVQSHWQVYKSPAAARRWLEPMAEHLRDAGIGTVSEIFDGDAPFTARGCFAQAWGVAEMLRTWVAIARANKALPAEGLARK
ncbi:MAG: glycogen debranching protein [Cyanothece sp. SIO2G6]|nr:glycogen debranching protein [Cyanothece sp. SIO2G6]